VLESKQELARVPSTYVLSHALKAAPSWVSGFKKDAGSRLDDYNSVWLGLPLGAGKRKKTLFSAPTRT
jgi:hypothetical protein